jgi:hypothetical protein
MVSINYWNLINIVLPILEKIAIRRSNNFGTGMFIFTAWEQHSNSIYFGDSWTGSNEWDLWETKSWISNIAGGGETNHSGARKVHVHACTDSIQKKSIVPERCMCTHVQTAYKKKIHIQRGSKFIYLSKSQVQFIIIIHRTFSCIAYMTK